MKKLVASLFVMCAFAVAQQTTPPAPQSEQPGTPKPITQTPNQGRVEPMAAPYTPGLDVKSMDRTADPCVDFYQYSCGGWRKNNPIPPDQTAWSVYGKLHQENLTFLRGILEQAAKAKQRDTVTQKIGDYYGACMDEAAVDKLGAQPLKSDLDAIAAVQNNKDLAPVIARFQVDIIGSPMFGAGSTQDPDDSEQVIAALDQGGIGLPDRDYYTKEDAKSKEIRDRYVQHVANVFKLLGEDEGPAKKDADTVMRMETDFAKSQQTRVERRDPYKLKHKMDMAGLKELMPNFNWEQFFSEMKTPEFKIVNVASPNFFKQLNHQLDSTPIEDWKAYLRFHVANSLSPFLSKPFVDENFNFYRAYLRGAKEQQPRWRRCVQYVDNQLGEALGQAYVKKAFSPKLKEATLDITKRIEDMMEERIKALDWMSEPTKEQALIKLHGIRNKIGYPDKWRDYSSVEIKPDDFLGNSTRAIAFESHRQLDKIGKPVDRNEWGMTPPTVNAYYDPQMNDINFPAGVLQPPLYDPKMDDAPNFGNTGGTIGHELTHGFDDEGSQFDAKGNLKNWWTEDDRKKFDERTKCVEDQYAQYVVVDDIHINSALTLGEDVADLGGTILAYEAWKQKEQGKKLQNRDGLTPDQRFFVGYAQWACENVRPENERVSAATDPHSPGKYRVNGLMPNIPEFGKAFSCKADAPMVKPKEKVCRIW